jgi:ribosome biogenesis GTPase
MLGLEALVLCQGESVAKRALIRRALRKNPGVVVGDVVKWTPIESPGEGPGAVIVGVEPRRSLLSRPDHRGKAKPVAANLDYLVIVATPAEPPLRLGLIDRYMAAAAHNGIASVICLNKVDLDHDGSALAALAPYRDLGMDVVATSALEREGIEPLRAVLAGHRSAFVGHSGVGKSSLANSLIPGLDLRIGNVNETIGRGRHTTTSSRLISVPGGGELVDTPGIRSFGLTGIDPRRLSELYPEFVERVDDCRFRGCSHTHEPGCSVRPAVETGEIDAGRYARYLQIRTSLQEEGQ